MKLLTHILAHTGVVLSVVFMVFAVLDKFNPIIGFLTNQYSTPLLWVFCIASLLNGVILLILLRRD